MYFNDFIFQLSSVREQAISFKNRRASAGSLITLRNEGESSSNSVVTASDFDIDPNDMPKIIKVLTRVITKQIFEQC